MTESNGIMKNIIIEFLDWYNEGALFHSVIALSTASISIQIITSVGLMLFTRLSGIIQNSLSLSPDTIWVLSIFGMLLSMITWVAMFHIAPVVSFLSIFSIYNIIFMIPFIIFFHFEDLLCIVDRGGYFHDPLLLPFAKWICYIAKSLPGVTGECSTEREILKETCKVFKIVPKLVWAVFCLPPLIFIQIALLYVAMLLKFVALMNPITLIYWLAGELEWSNDGTTTCPDSTNGKPVCEDWTGGVSVPIFIPAFRIKELNINIKEVNYDLSLKWRGPLDILETLGWDLVKDFLSPNNWANSIIELSDNITWLDKMTWQVNNVLIYLPAKAVKEGLFGEESNFNFVTMKEPIEMDWLDNGANII